MNINQFPQDVQDFIHELCAKAVGRAIKNGTYHPEGQDEKIQTDVDGS
ncbi:MULTISPECIES: hypothetical protein [Paenibacillus]|nr:MULTISPECIES: hypothetical protein [Paenibacillus]MEC0107239.1 hypothetical protein [Paenibacillus taichungensis]MEC0194829.1 hypothetical protein [Paenibacillus taichungensis]UPK45739.1 hypothetical protein KET34_09930 [Paenibacillus pabuli]